MELFTIVIFSLIVNGLFSLIPAKIAGKKGHSAVGYWAFGFFLSFVLALVIALVVEDRENPRYLVNKDTHVVENGLSQTLQCPSCAEWIKAEATICKHCHSNVKKEFTKILEGEKSLIEKGERDRVEALKNDLLESERMAAIAEEARLERNKKLKAFSKSKPGLAILGVVITLVIASFGISIYSVQKNQEAKASELAKIESTISPYLDWSPRLQKCNKPDNAKFVFSSNKLKVEVVLTKAGVDPSEGGRGKSYFLDDSSFSFMDCIYGAILPRFESSYSFQSVFSRLKNPGECSVDLEWIKSSDDEYRNYEFTRDHGYDNGYKLQITLSQGKDYIRALRSWANKSSSKIFEYYSYDSC